MLCFFRKRTLSTRQYQQDTSAVYNLIDSDYHYLPRTFVSSKKSLAFVDIQLKDYLQVTANYANKNEGIDDLVNA